MIVVDSVKRRTPYDLDTFAEMVKIALDEARIEIILVLNKIDLLEEKCELLEITRALVSLINGVKLGPERASEASLGKFLNLFMI